MAEKLETGRIVRSLSGFYDVVLPDGTLTCKARGILRKQGLSPLTGDMAVVTRQGEKGMVEQILPRKNSFVRPAVAQCGCTGDFCRQCESRNGALPYRPGDGHCGQQGRGKHSLREQNGPGSGGGAGKGLYPCWLPGDLHQRRNGCRTGRTPAGYSGKAHRLHGQLRRGQEQHSQSALPQLGPAHGRGFRKAGPCRHTTRHVELFPLDAETFVMDTPGFSSFDTDQMDIILKENLQYAFPDFGPFLGRCQFQDCAHRREPAAPSAGPWNQARSSPPAMTATFAFTKRPPSIKSGNISECPPAGCQNRSLPGLVSASPSPPGKVSRRQAGRKAKEQPQLRMRPLRTHTWFSPLLPKMPKKFCKKL